MRQPVTIMGSICSSNNNNSKAGLPPQDLGELLQQAEKAGSSVPWLAEFQDFLAQQDLASLPPPLPAPTTHTTATTSTTATTTNTAITPTHKPTTASTQQDRSLAWRLPLLNFILEVRAVLRKGAPKEGVSAGLGRLGAQHLTPEGGLALSDHALRERLVNALGHWGEAGAQGARRGLVASSASVLERPSEEVLLGLLQEAYLDIQVWDRAEKLYRKFCQKRAGAGLPPLAVLLSIL